jgi:hypothetical protein
MRGSTWTPQRGDGLGGGPIPTQPFAFAGRRHARFEVTCQLHTSPILPGQLGVRPARLVKRPAEHDALVGHDLLGDVG